MRAKDNTAQAWYATLCYTFQIYFDFSGYSDMAIGLGRMMGFTFPENFNNPYISKSITEFWRRWHITLSTWMRDYLYIPLGGNRVSTNSIASELMGGISYFRIVARCCLDLCYMGCLSRAVFSARTDVFAPVL
ncbi:MAG: MBOAT family O-acyltransferase [Owenweeksia sp.]|nr:MBOAT family O-acyltransferase [Owenweeksia sp.]